jgi:acetyl-CoA hydrolase
VRQRLELGGVEVFLGASFGETLRPEHADALRFRALGGFGANARLARAGVLDVVPAHLSSLPGLIASGELGIDVVFALLSPADGDGLHHLGLAGDYLEPAIERARVVLAEINPGVPRTRGAPRIAAERIAAAVFDERPILAAPAAHVGAVERRLAACVAERVPDGATLQIGIGAAPEAVCEALAGHRDLGVHSALVNDAILDLIEAGAVTNARKPIDTGVTVTGLLFGSRRLFEFADDNPLLRSMPIAYTHGIATLARLDHFFAINSALEVDLTGQINAEAVGGVHVGAVGGVVDFVRGTQASAGGRSIVALPSAARGGTVSRIVPRLLTVTSTARSDADLIATEYGVAELRGQGLAERARRMIAIAHPDFREELERAAHRLV